MYTRWKKTGNAKCNSKASQKADSEMIGSKKYSVKIWNMELDDFLRERSRELLEKLTIDSAGRSVHKYRYHYAVYTV